MLPETQPKTVRPETIAVDKELETDALIKRKALS
jgi:hypothetical protein